MKQIEFGSKQVEKLLMYLQYSFMNHPDKRGAFNLMKHITAEPKELPLFETDINSSSWAKEHAK